MTNSYVLASCKLDKRNVMKGRKLKMDRIYKQSNDPFFFFLLIFLLFSCYIPQSQSIELCIVEIPGCQVAILSVALPCVQYV